MATTSSGSSPEQEYVPMSDEAEAKRYYHYSPAEAELTDIDVDLDDLGVNRL